MECNVTDVFWTFSRNVLALTYDELSETAEFKYIQQAVHQQTPFKIKVDDICKVCEFDLDARMPSKTCTDGDWLYFKDVTALFYGMYELCNHSPQLEKVIEKMGIMEDVSYLDELITDLTL